MQITTGFASTAHVDDIARVSYDAFEQVAKTHGVVPDFPDVDTARHVYRMLVDRSDYYGIVAFADGKVVGSNFLSTTDAVAGIGPLSIDPKFQGLGIGRKLMMEMLNYAKRHDIEQVRLLQDAHNLASLSLYTSLGFDARYMAALITTVPDPIPDHSIRAVTPADMRQIETLCRMLYKTSRHNEVVLAMKHGFPAFLRERSSKVVGYLVPGLVGHSVCETEEDALALLREAARMVPSSFARVFCPVNYAGLLRSLLKVGGKIEKTLTYMTIGPYEPAEGVCTPSAGY